MELLATERDEKRGGQNTTHETMAGELGISRERRVDQKDYPLLQLWVETFKRTWELPQLHKIGKSQTEDGTYILCVQTVTDREKKRGAATHCGQHCGEDVGEAEIIPTGGPDSCRMKIIGRGVLVGEPGRTDKVSRYLLGICKEKSMWTAVILWSSVLDRGAKIEVVKIQQLQVISKYVTTRSDLKLFSSYEIIAGAAANYSFYIDGYSDVYGGRGWLCPYTAEELWVAVLVNIFPSDFGSSIADKVFVHFNHEIITCGQQWGYVCDNFTIGFVDKCVVRRIDQDG
ncbi:hypothetical protein J6590_080215 [Homalodisca vitripennis]|nr:hypothetical protein J6590_080215 [Homalodisca vitripennis]